MSKTLEDFGFKRKPKGVYSDYVYEHSERLYEYIIFIFDDDRIVTNTSIKSIEFCECLGDTIKRLRKEERG